MHSFTQDLICVTYVLLSETMHLLQVQPDRGRRREALKMRYAYFEKTPSIYWTLNPKP